MKFFEKRGHAVIPSAPLVPENDPSVLFNTAGMQPLVPYLMGAPHPQGKRLVNAQKCVRTQDIDEVGDNTHDTFFEMLGNWSLGDYFKEDAIKWSYEFLTSKEEGLGLDPKRLYVTVFEGNNDAPRDNEAFEIWKKYVPENRIYFMPAKSNWWSPGDNGPCGPDTEMFYDVTERGLGDMTKEEYMAADDRQDVVEIWNDVFMEYEKEGGKVVGKLASKNVDTGSGLERVVMMVQGKNNIFDTDLFVSVMGKIKELVGGEIRDVRASRIVADHIRTGVMIIADGVRPANTDQGYILRRLLRRAVRYADVLGIGHNMLAGLVPIIAEKYTGVYDNVAAQATFIADEIRKEEEKFRQMLERGMKEFAHISKRGGVSAVDVFQLFSTYGFPLEMTEELAKEQGITVDRAGFEAEFKKHQDLSRTSTEGKFKGGLANNSEKTTALHTATHLMLAGLRKYLGDSVHQAGSNITEERTRFDFTYPEKVPRDVLDKVEAYVNEAIGKHSIVKIEQMKKEDAKAAGVEGSFWEKYPDVVNVYSVVVPDSTTYSRELCGGPHVVQTEGMGKFKIVKEEASSAGIRRIKAVLE
ncbi:MAG: Alanine-tRNA ligase [Parcubacteria group bacterium GW2011_GWA1_47_8]|nr:MAG: Alanine-tRNA ligase [Parcubacteria group bacterium GW2011_GWA1_47_8]KKW07222.1 MAG: Alanine-tRNA ligase [Parcubacteria group bacterium GW2011_GWA2_49_16]